MTLVHSHEGVPADRGQRAWTQVVLSGMKNKIANVLARKEQFGEKERLESDTIWEEETIAQKLMAQRATAMIQNTLFTETVLFSFKAADFQHHTHAYKLVNDKIGAIISGRPITKFGNPQRNELIIEVKFVDQKDAFKAVNEGLAFKDIHYKGVPTNDGAHDKLVRLSLSQLPFFVSRQELSDGLRHSLSSFGRVCQVKRLTNRGYFEGAAVVMLDCSPQEQTEWLPLERRLYLDKWDMVVPASFKGAPPVCFLCRESGHIRKFCPRLENVTCYNCRNKGHYARHCPNHQVPEGQQLVAYAETTQKMTAKQQDIQDRPTKQTETMKETDPIRPDQHHTEIPDTGSGQKSDNTTEVPLSVDANEDSTEENEYKDIMETDAAGKPVSHIGHKLSKNSGVSNPTRNEKTKDFHIQDTRPTYRRHSKKFYTQDTKEADKEAH